MKLTETEKIILENTDEKCQTKSKNIYERKALEFYNSLATIENYVKLTRKKI
jgi:hypothetical protein